MNFEVIPTPDFEKSFKALAKRHRSLKKDIREFTDSLQQNPFQGDELTNLTHRCLPGGDFILCLAKQALGVIFQKRL